MPLRWLQADGSGATRVGTARPRAAGADAAEPLEENKILLNLAELRSRSRTKIRIKILKIVSIDTSQNPRI
jgi:hypothetical protein